MIIGAAMAVHSTLRWGLLEQVYQEALHIELLERGLDNQREKEIEIYYKTHLLDKKYKMDIVVGDVIVELKSVAKILPEHRSQLCNYLRLAKKPIGILVNFGNNDLIAERWIYDEDSNECWLADRRLKPIEEIE